MTPALDCDGNEIRLGDEVICTEVAYIGATGVVSRIHNDGLSVELVVTEEIRRRYNCAINKFWKASAYVRTTPAELRLDEGI